MGSPAGRSQPAALGPLPHPAAPLPGPRQGRRRLSSLNRGPGRRRGLRGRREGEEVGLGQCENAEGRPGETRLGPRRGARGAPRGGGWGKRREGPGARRMTRRRARQGWGGGEGRVRGCRAELGRGAQGRGGAPGRGRGPGRGRPGWTWEGAPRGPGLRAAAESGVPVAGAERLWLHHVPESAFSGIRPGGLAGRQRWANQSEPAGQLEGCGPGELWVLPSTLYPYHAREFFCESAPLVLQFPPSRPHPPSPSLPSPPLPHRPPPMLAPQRNGLAKGRHQALAHNCPTPTLSWRTAVRALPFYLPEPLPLPRLSGGVSRSSLVNRCPGPFLPRKPFRGPSGSPPPLSPVA